MFASEVTPQMRATFEEAARVEQDTGAGIAAVLSMPEVRQAIHVDVLTGPGTPVEHCGKPMHWGGSSTSWQGQYGSGVEQTCSTWICECGATLNATVRVPS